jgi:excinuclease ABC subunit B
MSLFQLESTFSPCGDQGDAIRQLCEGFSPPLQVPPVGELRHFPHSEHRAQTLLGVTGSGKTFTMANVIQNLNRPTLILSHNKTLAAQLYGEFKAFFPKNAVEFFISYYDYYQPEAYLAASDTFIEKDASINEEIDRLRLKATCSLLERRDVVIVASVSAIYGLGNPKEYAKGLILLKQGETLDRQHLLRRLVDSHYLRAGMQLERGTFRVRGDVIEIHPAYEDHAIRLETFGDEIECITVIDPVTGNRLTEKPAAAIYPARHFVLDRPSLERALGTIKSELAERVDELTRRGQTLEAHRLSQRTQFDMEMMQELGYCSGIENYSRHLDGRAPGTRPSCLMDYFPDDLLVILDESHVTLPQLRAMYRGDLARKDSLVNFGFRLPCARDNRPLTFEEFEAMTPDLLFVSATPSDYELERSEGEYVEQLIRPTGLLDPKIDVRPTEGQVEDLVEEILTRAEAHERVLVTTLTKRMAEDLATHFSQRGIRVRYLHSDVESLKRVELIRDLRLGVFDVLIGVNLLREGLDLPEVTLVAVLDADRQGFLRSARSLFQIAGRASRNSEGLVVFYADKMSDAMDTVIRETKRRRKIQMEHNATVGQVPKTVLKDRDEILASTTVLDEAKRIESYAKGNKKTASLAAETLAPFGLDESMNDLDHLRNLMEEAAGKLDFEKAALLRDRIQALQTDNGDDHESRSEDEPLATQEKSRLQRKQEGRTKQARAMKRMHSRSARRING